MFYHIFFRTGETNKYHHAHVKDWENETKRKWELVNAELTLGNLSAFLRISSCPLDPWFCIQSWERSLGGIEGVWTHVGSMCHFLSTASIALLDTLCVVGTWLHIIHTSTHSVSSGPVMLMTCSFPCKGWRDGRWPLLVLTAHRWQEPTPGPGNEGESLARGILCHMLPQGEDWKETCQNDSKCSLNNRILIVL